MKFQRNKGVRRSIGVSNPTKFVRTEIEIRKASRLSMLAIPEDLPSETSKQVKTPKATKTKCIKKSNSSSFLRKKFQLKKFRRKFRISFQKSKLKKFSVQPFARMTVLNGQEFAQARNSMNSTMKISSPGKKKFQKATF